MGPMKGFVQKLTSLFLSFKAPSCVLDYSLPLPSPLSNPYFIDSFNIYSLRIVAES